MGKEIGVQGTQERAVAMAEGRSSGDVVIDSAVKAAKTA